MPTDNHAQQSPTVEEQLGFIATPTTGASELAGQQNNSISDPNALAMNDNAEAAKERQLTGEPPGSTSPQDSDNLPSAQSPVFEEGT